MSLSPKEEAVLKLLKEDAAFENYFFSKVVDLKWFDDIKKQGYFNPIKAPGPKPADQKGYFSIPVWNVLSYLERVSEQVTLPGNEKYIDELLQIIQDVSTYKDEKEKHIDNYRTWWYFVKILLKIPNEKIPIPVIELIPIWLASQFSASLPGSEISQKLLPKFLTDNPEDIRKAEMIINYITVIKPVKLPEERVRLYKKEIAFTLIIDKFQVKKAFEKHAEEVGQKCSRKVIDDLSSKIHLLLKKNESVIPIEVDDTIYRLVLSEGEYQYILKIFDAGEKDKEEVFEEAFLEQPTEGQLIKETSLSKGDLRAFVDRAFDESKNIEHLKSLKDLRRKFANLYRNLYDRDTYPSLYDETRSSFDEPLEVFTYILKNVLLGMARKDSEATNKIIGQFFDDPYLYFKKMALYIVGNNIKDYTDSFWQALEKDTENILLEGLYFGDELKHVLEGLKEFSSSQRKLLIDRIEAGPGYVPDENGDLYIARWKQERYNALIKDPEFRAMYESLKALTGGDAALYPAIGKITTKWGEGAPPISVEEISKIPNQELAEFLSEFRTKSFWEGPTVGGLANAVKDAALQKPEKFTDDLYPFMNSYFIYVHKVLDGILEAWKQKKTINWDNIFLFLNDYINRQEFWGDHFILRKDEWLEGADHNWIIGSVTELIREGTRDDAWAFEEELLEKAEKILFLILGKVEVDRETGMTDYVTHSLNTPIGKAIMSLINLALRIARINDKKALASEVKWNQRIKEKYDDLLKANVIESYVFLGRYLPSLYYLDKEWVKMKIKSLYLEVPKTKWEAFMEGYLSIGQVYDTLYKLMRLHYESGIEYDFKNTQDNEHLIQHIALSYLLGSEEIAKEGSLFKKLLERWKPDEIVIIINFFWSQQGHLENEEVEENKEIIEKILDFWKWVHEHKLSQLGEIPKEERKVLAALSKLAVFLPRINEEYSTWLMLAAPYAEETYDSSFLIDYLNKFADPESWQYVGKIFFAMLKKYIPDFREEAIRSIIDKLYVNGHKEDADGICEIYGKNGIHFLRNIYDKYNG
jgi:hypothetical protein